MCTAKLLPESGSATMASALGKQQMNTATTSGMLHIESYAEMTWQVWRRFRGLKEGRLHVSVTGADQ